MLPWLWHAAARFQPRAVHFVLEIIEPKARACRFVRPLQRVALSSFPVINVVNVVRVHLLDTFDLRKIL